MLRYEISENLRELRALGETNKSGESSLKELSQNNSELLAMREQMAASTQQLEGILSFVEQEWKRRSLQEKTNILTQKAQKATAEHSARRMLPDMPLDFEDQITHEIETYLQLEKETQQRLEGL